MQLGAVIVDILSTPRQQHRYFGAAAAAAARESIALRTHCPVLVLGCQMEHGAYRSNTTVRRWPLDVWLCGCRCRCRQVIWW